MPWPSNVKHIGENTADNVSDTTLVVGNKDGSILERLEDITQELSGATGIVTFPASAIPANNVSLAEVIREMYDQMDKVAVKAAATIVNAQTLFTITGGPIEIISLYSLCVTANDATASTLQYQADGTDGSAATISGASASLGSAAAGDLVAFIGTALTTAPTVNANGPALGATRPVVVPAGVIKAVVGVGSTTGTWTHHLRYRPLARGVVVV
jgi:hypothetical protein